MSEKPEPHVCDDPCTCYRGKVGDIVAMKFKVLAVLPNGDVVVDFTGGNKLPLGRYFHWHTPGGCCT